MSEGTAHETGSPVEWTVDATRSAWRSLRTIYYANSLSWRVLKSGALLFLGFFLWSSSNLLLSYQGSWTFMHYPMAYGFVLVWYGPIHHFVVIPLSMRLRKKQGSTSKFGRWLPNIGLVAFLILVVYLGTNPAPPVTFDFASQLSAAGVDVSPDLLCTKSAVSGGAAVHCHLSESQGIHSVTVESGGTQIAADTTPPFDFTIHERDLETVVGDKQFQVVLRDENGDTIRRYTRTLDMIPEG